MPSQPPRPTADRKLVQIVDSALADVVARSGEWLACRPGCTQCCVGVFAINQLDAARLREGLRELEREDPARARRIKKRARQSQARLRDEFPGNSGTGLLGESEDERAQFEDFANDEVCPALDPQTGYCDLYAWRPMTCRVFGPPVQTEDGIGVCELCFQGATEGRIAAAVMNADPDGIESKLVAQLKSKGYAGDTTIAFVLAKGGKSK